MSIRRFLVAAIALFLTVGATDRARAADGRAAPLVDAAWIKTHVGDPDVVVLDVRNAIDGGSATAYRRGHVPGAVYSNYLRAGWRTRVDGVPGQLPPLDDLAALIGGLGIGNETRVVIVAGGVSASDIGSATRVYWTFKVLGHDTVSILDGGWRAWASDPANPVESGWIAPTPATFMPRFQPQLVADADDVAVVLNGGAALIDNRPPAQYKGAVKARVVARYGTIPGAGNMPEGRLVGADGRFVGRDRLAALLAEAGATLDGPTIAFCNTGHWASLGWFVASELLGNNRVRLYDGSMADWAARPERPVERQVATVP